VIPRSKPAEPAKSQLVFDGEPVATMVEGRLLEAQFEFGSVHVLILSDDCPYEEILHVYLLDDDLNALEHIELGTPLVSGVLRDVAIEGSDTVTFSFDGSTKYRLTVHPQPKRSIRSLPSGARRRAGSWIQPKRLELSAD
jgi:hypothetical protein